jgi:uncharacterized protein YebE (UPF0316 family)
LPCYERRVIIRIGPCSSAWIEQEPPKFKVARSNRARGIRGEAAVVWGRFFRVLWFFGIRLEGEGQVSIFLEALLIFGLRVLGIAVSTLATLMTVQGRRLYAMVAGFISALVYVIAIGKVVANLGNVWNVLAYCGGFAVGTLIGMTLERRLALGFAEVRFISIQKSDALAEALRREGFGVTEYYGYGRKNAVGVVEVIVPRKSVDIVLRVARSVDENAITTVKETRTVQHGYWKSNARR